jgi:hypothetical protein
MKEALAEHSSCMTFDRSGYIIMLWTDTHTHTYVYIDIRKSKLAGKIQNRKRSGWDFMNSFICKRIYTFWPTQTCTENAQSMAFTVCGCCNAPLQFLIKFQGVDLRWWASFGFLLHVVMFLLCPCVSERRWWPDDLYTYIRVWLFLCACYICVVQLDTCPDLLSSEYCQNSLRPTES